jgi:hypothetical protein
MIDHVIVIYKNYNLLELQAYNFKERFNSGQYRLIIVDNTPDNEKIPIKLNGTKHLVLPLESQPTFDGVSHGRAIDFGLKYCESNIVGIIDSDFFVLTNNMYQYIQNKFENGYKAVGCEYNDGEGTSTWVNINPKNFENIPCCFGAYYDINLALSASWVITEAEVNANRSTGFVEVGSKIRKYILENNIKTTNWKNDASEYGTGFFRNENNDLMGVHYVAGSHRRWTDSSKEELIKILGKKYD